jgi:hypothetical protein
MCSRKRDQGSGEHMRLACGLGRLARAFRTAFGETPKAARETRALPGPFVEMTLNQMEQFGFSAKATRSANAIPISPGGYSPSSFYAIEPDATDRPNRSDHRFA